MKFKIIRILSIILVFPFIVFSKNINETQCVYDYKQNNIENNTINSSINSNFINILEKTNQQLVNYYTPINILVAALGVLIAVIAVVAAVSLFLQGKEYKDNLNKTMLSFFDERKKEMQSLTEELLKDRKGEIDKLIIKTKEELKEAKSNSKDGRTINDLKSRIKALEDAKINYKLDDFVSTVSKNNITAYNDTGKIRFGSTAGSLRICPNCGENYFDNALSLSSRVCRQCPRCGYLY